ncbi:MAG: type IV pilus assembly protein PilM [bacterium]|nr:type IV pilus assembly protein PilM [bacterium]
MAFSDIFKNLNIGKTLSGLKKEQRYLGVDIGSSSIKVVQLRKDKERPILETYGELSLARYGTDGQVGRSIRILDDKLVEALKDIIKEAQVTAGQATVSIPIHDSFLTTIEMPNLPEAELKEAVPFEARKYIPIPMSEVVIDWWILPPQTKELKSASPGSGQKKFINIILAAVPKDIIAKYSAILKAAGLEVAAFEIEVFALARASLREAFGSIMLIDFGASTTKIAIADAGVVRAAHSVEHGGQELSLALSQSLSIDFDRAEILKRQAGFIKRPENEEVISVLEPLFDFVSSEGERFLIDWKRKGGRAISKVLIGGGGALTPGIKDVLIKTYGVEVELINPFHKVIYPAFLEPALKDIGPSFANAVGLALREF